MAEVVMEQQVVKSGVLWFEFTFSRTSKGLYVWVKADPSIEPFVRSLGTGEQSPLEYFGRSWFSVREDQSLMLYDYSQPIQHTPQYYFGDPCTSLIHPRSPNLVNITFLRLVGISEPEGLTFGVKGPFKTSEVLDIGQKIILACREVAREYIVPVDIHLVISS